MVFHGKVSLQRIRIWTIWIPALRRLLDPTSYRICLLPYFHEAPSYRTLCSMAWHIYTGRVDVELFGFK